MNYTKSMIDLIKEIRRRADADTKPNIKMANPDLFSELTTIFHQCNDAVTLALIKELFQLAGDPWSSALNNPEAQPERKIVKTYRGQSQLVDSPAAAGAAKQEAQQTLRIYRGQVVRS